MEIPIDTILLYRKDDAPNPEYVKDYSLSQYDKVESTIDLAYVWCIERSVVDDRKVTSIRTTFGTTMLILMPIEKVRQELQQGQIANDKRNLFNKVQ